MGLNPDLLLRELESDSPLDHYELAMRLEAPVPYVLKMLRKLQRTGRVDCVRPSQKGCAALPGLWER